MRVLMITEEYPSKKAGGVASIAYEMDRILAEQDIDLTTVCTTRFQQSAKQTVFLAGKGPSIFYHLTFGAAFRRFVLKNRREYDLFHFHLPNGFGPLLFAPKGLRSRSIATVHTTFHGYLEYVYKVIKTSELTFREIFYKLFYIRLLERLERTALSNAGKVTSVSTGVEQELHDWYGIDKVIVINNGIDLKPFIHREIPLPNTPPQILFVGRLTAQKGLLRGLVSLKRIEEPFNVVIAGTGYLRQKVRDYADTHGMSVRFLGFVDRDKISQVYAKANILLMPSYYEGLPVVGIEAAASGLPIAATEGARIHDIVGRENRASIVPTYDEESLSKTVEAFLKDPTKRDRIGRENRENAIDKFSAERMVKSYTDVYWSMG